MLFAFTDSGCPARRICLGQTVICLQWKDSAIDQVRRAAGTHEQTDAGLKVSHQATMPCLRSLGKSLRLYDLHVRSQAAVVGPLQPAAFLQQRASITDIVCEPATGTPAHPFQPVSSASTTGDTFVPKGAKLSGLGAHPLARYR